MPVLQEASKKELFRIVRGIAVLTALELVVFALLGVWGIVSFGARIVVSALLGALMAGINFTVLCYTVQRAAAVEEVKNRRAVLQLSYNGRMLSQGIWCVLCLAVRSLQPVAGILPLLFPRVVIFILQITGVYRADADREAARLAQQEDDAAAAAGETDAAPEAAPDEGREN